MQAGRVRGTGIFEIDEMEAVRDHEADRPRQLLGDVLQAEPDQVAELQALHHRGAHRYRARPNTVFLVARQIDELPHPSQRVGQARDRGSRQPAAIGDFQVAEPRLMALEAAQHVERARRFGAGLEPLGRLEEDADPIGIVDRGDEARLEETVGAALKVHEDVVRVREREVLEGV